LNRGPEELARFAQKLRAGLPQLAGVGELIGRATEAALTVSAARALEAVPAAQPVLAGVTTVLLAPSHAGRSLTASAPAVADMRAVQLEFGVRGHARMSLDVLVRAENRAEIALVSVDWQLISERAI
jgi:hypothetical protein